MQHFRGKNQLVHSSTTLNYNATDFHSGGEMYGIPLAKKEHLLGFVGDNEVKIES